MSIGTRVPPRPRHQVAGSGKAPPTGDRWWAWLFVGGIVTGVLVFYIWPIMRTVQLSFFEQGAFGRSERWVGVENYSRLVGSADFPLALTNTIVYTGILLLAVPISVILAALIATPGLRGAGVYRVIFFLPYIAMPIAVALVWRLIFNGDFGVLNYALGAIGLPKPYWLSTPGIALVAVAIVGVWSFIGLSMVIIGAGLRIIPRELYEAASLDGAGKVRSFWHVTVPMLRPSIFFVSVITMLQGFQLFDLLFGMMGDHNPALAETQSIVYFFYDASFIVNDKGYGSAVAIVIMIIIALVTAAQFRIQRRSV